MSTQLTTLYGITKFTSPLFCAADALGKTVDVLVGSCEGKLSMPSLPNWNEQETDPLNKPLQSPLSARTRKGEKDQTHWGEPTSYPSGTALVKRALFEFYFQKEEIEIGAQIIHENFGEWLDLFEKYITLFTTQYTHDNIHVIQKPTRIETFTIENAGLKNISSKSSPHFKIKMSNKDEALHFDQLTAATQLSSQGLAPRLEYQILLEAYIARKNKDYRKAIIEAANALEICLTGRIVDEFTRQHISFGEKLLQKFRMLGGRFELIKLLEIPMPEKDYESLIKKPRNDVIHRAEFPDTTLANQVINEVEELLHLFSPQIHQDHVDKNTN